MNIYFQTFLFTSSTIHFTSNYQIHTWNLSLPIFTPGRHPRLHTQCGLGLHLGMFAFHIKLVITTSLLRLVPGGTQVISVRLRPSCEIGARTERS